MTAQDTTTPAPWADSPPAAHGGTDLVGAVFDRPDGVEMRVRRAVHDYPGEVVVGIDGQDQEWRADAAKVRTLVERKRAGVAARSEASAPAPTDPSPFQAEADGPHGRPVEPPALTQSEPVAQTPAAGVAPEQHLAAAHAAHQRLKMEQPDAIVVVAVGEAYEAYDVDAQVVADALDIDLAAVKYPGGGYGFRVVLAPPARDAQVAALTGQGRRLLVAEVADAGEVTVRRTAAGAAMAAVAPEGTAPPDHAPVAAAPPETTPAPGGHAGGAAAAVVEEERDDQEVAHATAEVAHATAVAEPETAGDHATAPGAIVAPAAAAGSLPGGEPALMAPSGTTPSSAITRHTLLVSVWLDVGVDDDKHLSVAPEVRLSVGPKKAGDAAPADVVVSRATLGPGAATGDLSALGALVGDLIATRRQRKALADAATKAEKARQTQRQKEEKKAAAQKKKDDDKLGGLKAAAGRAATPLVPAAGASAPPVPVPGATTPPAAPAQGATPAPATSPALVPGVPPADVQVAVAALARKDGVGAAGSTTHGDGTPPSAQLSLLDF